MEQFNIKRGDTSPSIRFSLIPNDMTLAGATVRFQMMNSRNKTVIDRPAQIISDQPPVVQYDWQLGDTDTAGTFLAEFRIQYIDTAIETFPNRGFIQVSINADVPDKEV
jgi:hypothetical protein